MQPLFSTLFSYCSYVLQKFCSPRPCTTLPAAPSFPHPRLHSRIAPAPRQHCARRQTFPPLPTLSRPLEFIHSFASNAAPCRSLARFHAALDCLSRARGQEFESQAPAQLAFTCGSLKKVVDWCPCPPSAIGSKPLGRPKSPALNGKKSSVHWRQNGVKPGLKQLGRGL